MGWKDSKLAATESKWKQSKPIEQPKQDTGFSSSNMIANIPGSAAQFGEDLITPIIHPVDTVSSISKLAAGLVGKIPDWIPTKAALNQVPGAKDWMNGSEETADAVGTFLKDRYGSVDALKTTLETDPVGLLSDISGIFTGGSTMIPGKIGKIAAIVGKTIDPINTVTQTAKSVGKIIPEALPRKMYESAAKWRPSLPEAQRNSMTETALKNEYMPTSSGVGKVNQKISRLNNDIGKLIDDLTASGKEVPIGDLLRNTEKLKKELGGAQNVDAISDVAKVEEIVNGWLAHPDIQGKGFVTPRLAQDLKKNLYEKINWNAKRATGTPAQEQTYKSIARGSKEELGKLDPQVDEINSQLQKLYELEPELERSASRIENLNLFGMDSGVKIGSASVVGGVKGAVLGALLALVELPRTKAKAAILLEKLRKTKALDPADLSTINSLLRQAAVQSGRITEATTQE